MDEEIGQCDYRCGKESGKQEALLLFDPNAMHACKMPLFVQVYMYSHIVMMIKAGKNTSRCMIWYESQFIDICYASWYILQTHSKIKFLGWQDPERIELSVIAY